MVLQGEFEVSNDPDTVLTAILGSCVATCLWDPVARIGGMNHILLPANAEQDRQSLHYGVNVMELLLNSIIRQGADRTRLQAKLFGGAKMLENESRIGVANAEFAKWFLTNEGIPVLSHCLGGRQGRKVQFNAVTGYARRKMVDDQIGASPTPPKLLVAPSEGPGDIELF